MDNMERNNQQNKMIQQFGQRSILIQENNQKQNKYSTGNSGADDPGRESEPQFLLLLFHILLTPGGF